METRFIRRGDYIDGTNYGNRNVFIAYSILNSTQTDVLR